MGAKKGQTKKSAGRQRLGLVVFGALLVVLFLGFAVTQGIGQPSVPSGDAVIVEGVPDEIGTVSEADVKRAFLQQVAQGGLKKPPKAGGKKEEELRTAAMNEIINAIWIEGQAEELGISATPKQIATELAQIKKQNFKTEAEYQQFLKTSNFTKADVLDRVKLQLLSTQIQEAIAAEAPPASNAEIADFYDASKDTQYTSPESRDVRTVVNEDEAKVEAAKEQLEKDDSPASWKKVAAKYSNDPTTKSKGGLQPALTEELLASQPTLKAAVFESPAGEIVGPIEIESNYMIVQVEKLNPEKVQTLKEVSAQIKAQLTQTVAQEVFSEFVNGFQSKWTARTFCAEDFLVESCSNYVGSGHPASAPPACYEADPKGGTPKECPAPVAQTQPSLPGTVTVLKPQGERLSQRPRPAGLEETGEEAGGAALPEGVPPGATEVPQEAPPEAGN